MILFSQHSGHSTCGRPCRPFSCSDAKYAAPATSTKLRPPPKGRPGTLGMGRGIAVHLSIDKGGAIGPDRREPAQAGPSQCDTIRPDRRPGLAALPAPPIWPASLTAPGFGRAPRYRPALVTLCCRSWSPIAPDPPLGAARAPYWSRPATVQIRSFCRIDEQVPVPEEAAPGTSSVRAGREVASDRLPRCYH